MPRQPARRRAVNAAPVERGPEPDQDRLEVATEQAEEAVSNLEQVVAQELPETDPSDPRIGRVLEIGTRHVAFEDGEYAVDPQTGVVLRRL